MRTTATDKPDVSNILGMILGTSTTNKVLISKIYKLLLQIDKKKIGSPIDNGLKTGMGSSLKAEPKTPTSIGEDSESHIIREIQTMRCHLYPNYRQKLQSDNVKANENMGRQASFTCH